MKIVNVIWTDVDSKLLPAGTQNLYLISYKLLQNN